MRALATEMDESTNGVRIELNKLTHSGLLKEFERGETIQYQANEQHRIYPEISSLVHKYLGFHILIDQVIKKLIR